MMPEMFSNSLVFCPECVPGYPLYQKCKSCVFSFFQCTHLDHKFCPGDEVFHAISHFRKLIYAANLCQAVANFFVKTTDIAKGAFLHIFKTKGDKQALGYTDYIIRLGLPVDEVAIVTAACMQGIHVCVYFKNSEMWTTAVMQNPNYCELHFLTLGVLTFKWVMPINPMDFMKPILPLSKPASPIGSHALRKCAAKLMKSAAPPQPPPVNAGALTSTASTMPVPAPAPVKKKSSYDPSTRPAGPVPDRPHTRSVARKKPDSDVDYNPNTDTTMEQEDDDDDNDTGAARARYQLRSGGTQHAHSQSSLHK